MQFHPNIENLLIGRGILGGGLTLPIGISVFSGEQPSAAELIANWSAYNSTNPNFLIHFKNVVWSHPMNGAAKFCSISVFPPPTLPLHTGTGQWCIIWTSNPSDGQLTSTALPQQSFLMGPVSALDGKGIVRFTGSTDFATGTARSIADGAIGSAL